MDTKVAAWLNAFRLRTLPLAFSSIIVGSFIHYREHFSLQIFILALVTALLLQVLSNLANDYGDSEKGTDNDSRIGPKRAIQSGKLSIKEMKAAIIINVILCLVSGISLVVLGIGLDIKSLILILIGLLAIVAAIKYTVGKFAFGYNGLGDLFVMLFFGLVGVVGAAFLQTQSINHFDFILAFSIGCFATGVLNLNNMRDYESDKASNKNTLVVNIGPQMAVRYHIVLIFVGMATAFYFIFETAIHILEYLPVFIFPFLFIQLRQIEAVVHPKDYDPFLKRLALSAFTFALLFAVSKIIA
jgi:1,4-dihydroxy-2-naphthoate octaprenyltransferase